MSPQGQGALGRALGALGVSIESVFEQLQASVTVLDATGKIRWQNAVSIARVGERRGRSFLELMAPEHRMVANAEFRRLLFNPGTSSTREVVVLAPDGKRRRTLAFSAAVTSAESVAGVVAVGVPLNWDDGRAPPPQLSPRLLETLELLTAGRSTKEIARELGVTVETARNHIRRLLHALDVHSRVEAVARARQLRIVTRVPSGSSGEHGDPTTVNSMEGETS